MSTQYEPWRLHAECHCSNFLTVSANLKLRWALSTMASRYAQGPERLNGEFRWTQKSRSYKLQLPLRWSALACSLPHTPRELTQCSAKAGYAHSRRETVSAMATRSRETQYSFLLQAGEHRADLHALETRVVEIKEELVTTRQTSENESVKHTELSQILEANLHGLNGRVRSVQSSIRGLRHLGFRVVRL